jgi:hypothetical protein
VADLEEAVKIAGEWTKQLALWATGTLVLSVGFLKDFVKGQEITAGWMVCLIASWAFLIISSICGHLAFGAPLTGAKDDPRWKMRINPQMRWLSAMQLISFGLGLASMVAFAASHLSSPSAGEQAASWKSIGCVGPFVSGSGSDIDKSLNAKECSEPSQIAELIRDRCKTKNGCMVVLVGSADKRPLRGKIVAEFGSNDGLARARSEWVRQRLSAALAFEPGRFVVLTTGPREHGEALADDKLQDDRSVRVYLMTLNIKEVEANKTT